MPNSIEAVAFDIDGTLYPNWRMYIASIPLLMRHMRLVYAFRKARMEIRSIKPLENQMETTIHMVAHYLNESTITAEKKVKSIIYGKWMRVFENISLYKGVVDTLTWIRKHGMQTAVISDFPVQQKLSMLQLSSYFDVAFSSEETQYLKPNPEPFLQLSRILQLKPEHILYVGNDYQYDILGAHAVGMKTAHLSFWKMRHTLADYSFHRYKDLLTWLQKHKGV